MSNNDLLDIFDEESDSNSSISSYENIDDIDDLELDINLNNNKQNYKEKAFQNIKNKLENIEIDNSGNVINNFDINEFKNIYSTLINENQTIIDDFLKIRSNFKLLIIDELDSLNELPKWNKIYILNQEELLKFQEDEKYIIELREYPFYEYYQENGIIVYYDYKTKMLTNKSINNHIIFYKEIKLSMRQMMELLLKNLENENLD